MKNVLFRDREKLLKFEANGRDFAKILRSLGQFILVVKRAWPVVKRQFLK